MSCRETLLLLLLLCSSHVQSSTHWVVTEDGRLHAQSDSLLSMRTPDDLASFLKQVDRVESLEDLKADLASKQDLVESTDDKDDDFEEKFLATEESCIKAGKRLPEFDLYISTVLPLENKGIRTEEYISVPDEMPSELLEPHCLYPELEFSMYAFEHLEGVQARQYVEGIAELGLKSAVTNGLSTEQFGHLVSESLTQNGTSWVLFNMAAFYWRIKGNAYEAIECLRRAMHFSPRQYRDIAYVSLGNILHRGRFSHEAAVVLEAAVDLSYNLNVNHFTLGNVYAVLTLFNRSIEYFDNTLILQPDFEAAEKRRWAVVCHYKLEQALDHQHNQLQDALDELRTYQKKHEKVRSLSEKVLSEQAPYTERIRSNVEFSNLIQHRKEGLQPLMGEQCTSTITNDSPSVQCVWKAIADEKITPNTYIDDSRFSSVPATPEQSRTSAVSTHTAKHCQSGIPESTTAAADNHLEALNPTKEEKLKSDKKSDKNKLNKSNQGSDEENSNREKPLYKKEDWPSKSECEETNSGPLEWDEYPTTYLPAENKGFDSRVFLAEAIDIPSKKQHPLPWYPPVCVNIVDLKQGEMFLDNVEAIRDRDQVPIKLSDPTMRQTLLSWVNNGNVEEAEVGQRILTALKQNLAPRWLLYHLAGLYWRVVGNNYHSIECLRRSLHFVPADYVDVPLINMANILYKWNRLDDALNMTRQALIFCSTEPITHFTQANLLAAKKNFTGAVYHYEKALELDPNYELAMKMLRNLKCVTRYHAASVSLPEKNVCPSLDKSGITKIPTCGKPITVCDDSALHLAPSPGDGVFSVGAFLRRHKNIDPAEIEAMKKFHKEHGLCSGQDCDHIIHRPGTEPYLKLTSVNGFLDQKLLFAAPEDEIGDENACIIARGDVRTIQCYQEDFATIHKNQLVHLAKVLDEMYSFMKDQEQAGEILVDDEASESDSAQPSEIMNEMHVDAFFDITCTTIIENGNEMVRCIKNADMLQPNPNPSLSISHDAKNSPPPKKEGGCVVDSTLRLSQYKPSSLQCKDYKEVDFQQFASTWLSVASEGSGRGGGNDASLNDIKEIIDLNEPADDSGESILPYCTVDEDSDGTDLTGEIDNVDGIRYKESLHYTSEAALMDVLKKLGGERESIETTGSRFANALNKNPQSWVSGCLSALYWRAVGDATNAITCLRMALRHAKKDNLHIPLLSLANILHKSRKIDDALFIAKKALESSPSTVVIHFSIGNMYAAKGDFKNALDHYKTTLTEQPDFEPAKVRIIAILCGGLHEDDEFDE